MRRWALILAVLLPCLTLVAHAAEPGRAPVYRVTGVAVSSRDGSRIPYCHFQIMEARTIPDATAVTGRGPRGISRQIGGDAPEVVADVHGRFQIDVPGPGRWRVRGFARNFRLQDYDAHDLYFSTVVLTPATPAIDLTFKLEPDSGLTGLIRDEAGEAVRNAQIVAETATADRSRGAWRAVGYAQTDDRGRYDLGGLAPGPYRLRAQAQPWYAQSTSRGINQLRSVLGASSAGAALDPSLDVVYAPVWFPGVDDESRAEPIRLAGGEERQVDLQLTAIPATHLKVPRPPEPDLPATDPFRGLRNAVVTRVSPAGGFGPGNSTTNGSETDFGGLSPGVYQLQQMGPDGRPEEGARQFRVLAGGGVVDLATATPLIRVRLLAEGVPDASLNEVVFIDAATGQNASADGNRFQNLAAFRRRRMEETPQERNLYLAPGTYEVYLQSSTNVLTGLSSVGARTTGATVEITDGNPTVTLHLSQGRGDLSGRVTMAGKAAVGTMVLLVPATLGQPGDLTPIRRDQSNTDGSFALRAVVPGRYIVVAIMDGWGMKWQDPATLAPYLAHGMPIAITPEGAQTIDLTAQNR